MLFALNRHHAFQSDGVEGVAAFFRARISLDAEPSLPCTESIETDGYWQSFGLGMVQSEKWKRRHQILDCQTKSGHLIEGDFCGFPSGISDSMAFARIALYVIVGSCSVPFPIIHLNRIKHPRDVHQLSRFPYAFVAKRKRVYSLARLPVGFTSRHFPFPFPGPSPSQLAVHECEKRERQ